MLAMMIFDEGSQQKHFTLPLMLVSTTLCSVD